jgi:hypothetical protein
VVREGRFPRSGNAVDGPIVLTAYPGEHPILDGTGVPGDDMVHDRGSELDHAASKNDGFQFKDAGD